MNTDCENQNRIVGVRMCGGSAMGCAIGIAWIVERAALCLYYMARGVALDGMDGVSANSFLATDLHR